MPAAVPTHLIGVVELPDPRLLRGDDGLDRCQWAFSHPLLLEYHDTEWGRPVHAEQVLYERLALKGFQAGLSCLIVLQKRRALRRAFRDFILDDVARLSSDELDLIVDDVEVIRNRTKIDAAKANAEATIELRDRGGLEKPIWSHRGSFGSDPDDAQQMPLARKLAAELRRCGFRFIGPTSVHAFMQASGVLPGHVPGCLATSFDEPTPGPLAATGDRPASTRTDHAQAAASDDAGTPGGLADDVGGGRGGAGLDPDEPVPRTPARRVIPGVASCG